MHILTWPVKMSTSGVRLHVNNMSTSQIMIHNDIINDIILCYAIPCNVSTDRHMGLEVSRGVRW